MTTNDVTAHLFDGGVTRVDHGVHLQDAEHRVVDEAHADADRSRAVGHQQVERGEHHERDAEHVARDVDEQLRLERSGHRCATLAHVQVRQPGAGHGEPPGSPCGDERRRAERVRYPHVQFAQRPAESVAVVLSEQQ